MACVGWQPLEVKVDEARVLVATPDAEKDRPASPEKAARRLRVFTKVAISSAFFSLGKMSSDGVSLVFGLRTTSS